MGAHAQGTPGGSGMRCTPRERRVWLQANKSLSDTCEALLWDGLLLRVGPG